MSIPNVLLVVGGEREWLAQVTASAVRTGFMAMTADCANGFHQALSQTRPSLVLLDLQMPDTDGIECLRHLAALGSRASIVLISDMDSRVLSAAREFGSALGLNMLDMMHKPVASARLDELLVRQWAVQMPLTAEDLSRAIEEYELVLHYQPILHRRAQGWVVDAVEALVRWQHPQRGLVMPGQFLELAEQGGLIAPLTDYVINESLRQIGHWHASGTHLNVAVNLMPATISDLHFPDRLELVLREYGVPPSQLTLEITEQAGLGDPRTVMDSLARLRLRGVGLSLDDFGVGTSSLTQLYKMPYTGIKIDCALVAEVEHSAQAHIVVEAIVNLARKLSLEVCAEGVENTQTFELMDRAGCTQLQGDSVSKPLPAAELEHFLLAWGAAA